jgi:hypothetical protein
MCIGLWWGNLKERDDWEDLVLDRRIILKWILKKWCGCVDWIYLAHDTDK